jgi:hypothetical protein
MIDLIARILSIAFPAASFAILVSLAYWIYRQKTSSPQAKFRGLNLAIFALLQSFCSISATIQHIFGAIQAEIYELWAIKFCYSLAPLAITFLLNAISVSAGDPSVTGLKDRFKKEPWQTSATLFLQGFALITALMTFLPNAILGRVPSLWYGSMYLVFFVSATIVLIAFLRRDVNVSKSKKAAFIVWGSAVVIAVIQFSRLFIEQFEGASPLLASSIYLVAVFLGGVMIHVGFTEKTAFERFVLPIPVAEHMFDLREGESVILTYSSAADKMKVFSAFIREGLEGGDAVWYSYPDEESETVRAKLKEHGIDVEKHEKDGSLRLENELEGFRSNGKLDFEKWVTNGLNDWAEMKRRGYKHLRDIEDVGDFSFVNGQWQKWITEYWLDPRWDDPNVSEWVEVDKPVGVVYDPFLMEITAINVEHMTETEVTEILKAFGEGAKASARFVDLIKDATLFSKLIGLDHEQLVGHKILLEFNPASDYEKVVDRLAKESMANVEPIFVFTSTTSPIHTHLAKQPTIKFFLTSISTSTPKSTSENEVLLPAKNTPLILDTLSKVLETYADANVCFVFDILSDLLTTIGREKTFIFLRHALDMLSSKKTTSLFLLNPSAHKTEQVSRIRGLFNNLLTYDKNGLKVVKTS